MATVWMRSKLAKMKPKTEPKWGVRTLAEHGPGQFKPRHFEPAKVREVVVLQGRHVQLCEPFAKRDVVPRLGSFSPIRACVVYALDVQSTLIKARR